MICQKSDVQTKQVVRKIVSILLVYVVLVFLFYFSAREQILYTDYKQEAGAREVAIGEIVDTDIMEQTIVYEGNYIENISFYVATYARTNSGKIKIEVYDNEKFLASQEYNVEEIVDNSILNLQIDKEITSSVLKIKITSDGATYGNAITFYATKLDTEEKVVRNGVSQEYALCVAVEGGKSNFIGTYYVELAVVFGILMGLIGCLNHRKIGKIINSVDQYAFLVIQLVKRDFKTKYKRSVLGFCWSFLNPLFTMLIQYVVFSTLFRSDIENFPVYLLSAGIIFNFFTESVGGGLGSIVGNAGLITKVYVPKYIYPFSKVLSTAINLILSMFPLILALWITGEEFTKAFLLIPFLFLCLIIFCIGMSLILSTCMVFFRDTQFLWGIVSLVWMYATPIFYPETIIPERFQFILQWNPMYHYLKFFRTVVMEGVSPVMTEYLYCIGFSVVVYVLGKSIFNRAQKKFVLYL